MSRRKDNPSRWRVWPKERKTKRAAVKPDDFCSRAEKRGGVR